MKERMFIQKAKDLVSLEEFIRKQFDGAKCGRIEIQYTPIVTRIIVHTVTPGLVVGSGGERILKASRLLKEKFNLKDPQIDVQKIENQYLDPYIMAQSIVMAIEDGTNYKRIGTYYISKIMNSGAIGCEIVISGKFSGQRARRERFTAGYLKKCGDPAEKDVAKGFAVASTKLGSTGVLVSIMVRRGDIAEKLKM
ncbi:MAG: 30S ribosomal protein S3 [Candidatus Aenigmatarchaeota archaeon]